MRRAPSSHSLFILGGAILILRVAGSYSTGTSKKFILGASPPDFFLARLSFLTVKRQDTGVTYLDLDSQAEQLTLAQVIKMVSLTAIKCRYRGLPFLEVRPMHR